MFYDSETQKLMQFTDQLKRLTKGLKKFADQIKNVRKSTGKLELNFS